MKRKIYTIWTTLLVVMLMATPVYAGNIKLQGSWGVGSIHFDGYATGVGGYDGITLALTGYGIPDVICTNQGGNDAPGQNPSQITVTGFTYISPDEIEWTTTKGKTPVTVSANENPEDGTFTLSGLAGGCPNDNWTATIVGMEWHGAIIDVYEGDSTSGTLLKTFEFSCDPSQKVGETLSCTQVSVITY